MSDVCVIPSHQGTLSELHGNKGLSLPRGKVSAAHPQPEPRWLPSPPPTRGFWKQNVGNWLALRILQNILEGYTTVHRNLFLNEKDKKQRKGTRTGKKERKCS